MTKTPQVLSLICKACPHVQPPPYAGVRICSVDGRGTHLHIAERHCPAGRYELGWGDTIAKVTHALGLRQCGGCAERQKWMNREPAD